MGHIRNHAIVVTGNALDHYLKEAHDKATEIFPWVSPISPTAVNGSESFFVPPDGSKEGWEDSIRGDKQREEFISFLGGSRCLHWVEVYFGGDDPSPVISNFSR